MDVEWMLRLARSGKGDVLDTPKNALTIMMDDAELKGLLAFNEFSSQYLITRAPPQVEGITLPGPYPRNWTGADVSMILVYMDRYNSNFTKSLIEDTMVTVAVENSFHPLRKWLEERELQWDGTSRRLDEWLTRAFGAGQSVLTKAIARRFLIAAVRRIRQPGCQFDHMLVLEGIQGLGKSTGIKSLFGADWYADSMPADLSGKDAAIAMQGIWCIELAEIDQLIRSEIEVIKAFLSRPVDRFRPPYAKNAVDKPRQAVLIGTTNSDHYLRDSTGNRRIWPVECKHVDLAWLKDNRDQLWAEAAAAESQGEVHWLETEELVKLAHSSQSDRMYRDVWEDPILDFIALKSEITIPDLLTVCLSMPRDKQGKASEMRVADILRGAGWRRKVTTSNGRKVRVWLQDHTF